MGISFADESNLVMAWAVRALAQITPFLGNTRVSWRTNLVEKQLHWHRRRAPSRGEDMNLGWAEGRIQQWWLKTSVQAELKRSGSNMGSSWAAVNTGLFESQFILLRDIIRQLQVQDMFYLLSEPPSLNWQVQNKHICCQRYKVCLGSFASIRCSWIRNSDFRTCWGLTLLSIGLYED